MITNACPRKQKKKKEKLSLYIDRFPQLKPLCLLPHTEPLISLVYRGLLTDSNKTDKTE